MASPFAAALAGMDAVLDTEMGEAVTLVPMRGGQYASQPDGERPTRDVVALVSSMDNSSVEVPKLDGQIAYEQWTIEIRRAELGGLRLRKGDEMILLDQQQAPRLVVTRVERDDPVRVVLLAAPIAS